MIPRYLQHYWNSGYVYGMAIGLLMLLFVPGDVALKLAIFAGVIVLTLLGAAFRFWRAGGQAGRRPGATDCVKARNPRTASADLPLAQRWTRDDPSVGILTPGPHQGRHVLAGFWPEDGFWYAVDGRISAKGEGLTYEELRSILVSEGARWLERGEYSEAVLAKYFTL